MPHKHAPGPTIPPAWKRRDVVEPVGDSFSAVDAVGFYDWDVNVDKLSWDRGAEERFGVPAGSMSTYALWGALLEPEDLARISADIETAVRKRHARITYHYRFHRPDGEIRIFEGVGLCWYDGDGALSRLMGVVLDITRSEARRRALETSETKLRNIIETVPDAMIMIDAGGTIRDFNAAAERMFGYAAESVLGSNVARLMPASMQQIHNDAIGRYMSTGERKIIGKTRTLMACRADGREFPIELSVGEAVVGHERLFSGFIRDISERVDAQQRLDKLRAQYLRTARLTAMGTVAAGLAHELNQPLAASANFVAAAKLTAEAGLPTAELLGLLEEANKQIALAGDIIRRLRGFLAPGEQRAEPQDLAAVVEEAISLALPGLARQAVAQSIEIDEDAGRVVADRVQLLQVMVNLLRNAHDAMADTPRQAVGVGAVRVGGNVEISVTDSGPGFDPSLVGAIDHPLISTKGAGSMGLGLSICRRIVETWNGSLRIDNAPGGGGSVTFTVPSV